MDRKQFPMRGLISALLALVGATVLLLGLQPRSSAAPEPAPLILPASALHLQSQPGLQVDKEGPDRVTILDTITYTIRITNASGQTFQNVIITDTYSSNIFPSNAPFFLAEYNGNYTAQGITVQWFTYTVNTALKRGEIYWHLGNLTPGASGTIVLTMSVPDGLQPTYRQPGPEMGPSDLENSLIITTSTPGVVGDHDIAVSSIVGPVLRLQKSYRTETGLPDKERVGRLVTYTIRVDNISTAEREDSWPATGLKVWEALPAYLDFVTATASVPGVTVFYTPTGRAITWTFPADFVLSPGEVTFVTFTTRISLTAPTDQSIKNDKNRCWAISAEMVKPAQCASDVSIRVWTPQYKTVETASPPTQVDKSYPNRPVTYTIYIYNPLQIEATGVVVTDAMPATFRFQNMVNGPQPAAILTNVVRWESLTLPPNGVISFTFRAWIGADTPVEANCGNRDYQNFITVTAPAFPVPYFTKEHGQVTVVPQITVSKERTPDRQSPGDRVVYTITLRNVGDTPVTGIIITDTLPPDFRFSAMASSPPGNPQILTNTPNVIWWGPAEGIPPMAPGGEFSFSFWATVDGNVNQSYPNIVSGYSPDTFICWRSGANVTVDTSFRYTKTTDPTVVVQGETFQYSVQWWNISSVRGYEIDLFKDTLPPGFYANGASEYVRVISPPVTLAPNGSNEWSDTFNVTVVGWGTGSQWCNDLFEEGKRWKWQERNTFGIRTTNPLAFWTNGERAAEVYVYPHVSLVPVANPNPVGLGSPFTVTLYLTNHIRSPAMPVTLTAVYYQLPAGFQAFPTAGPTPPNECSLQSGRWTCVWTNRVLPPSGSLALHLYAQAPFTLATFRSDAWAYPANMNLCVPNARLDINVVRGVELQKTPAIHEINPLGILEYTLEATNLTGGSVYNVRITDTFEGGFQYVETTSERQPISTSPLVWEIPYLGPVGSGANKETIRFRARAGVLVGHWYNQVDGVSPSTYVTRSANYLKGVEVFVISGIGLYKVAGPETVVAGESVVYTITLFNGSEYDIRNIRITDTLPAGFAYDSMVSGIPPLQYDPLAWIIAGPLRKSESLVLVFRARTDAQMASGRYYNRVSGSAEKAVAPYDPVLVPDTGDTAPVYVRGIPTVQRTKSVEPDVVRAGGEVTYTISLYNESDSAQTLRLTDTLPVSLTWAGLLEGPAPVMTSPVVVWDNLPVGVNQTVTLRFRATVDRLARSGTFYNRLDARADAFVLPPVETAPLTIQEIPRVDAQVSIDDGRITAGPGDGLEYTVFFTNASPITVENVILTATLDPADYLSISGAGWGEIGSGVYTYSVGSLPPGATGEVSLEAQISPDIPDTFWTVTATVALGYETSEEVIEENLENNTSKDVNVIRGPDLVVTRITWQPAQPTAGYPVTFYVTVRNQGLSAVTQRWNGDSSTWLFVTELYAKDPQAGPPTNVFDHIGGSCTSDGSSCERWEYTQWSRSLDVNEERTFFFSVTLPAGTYRTHAQVDVSWTGSSPWGQPWGLIREAREDNNIYSGSQIVVHPLRRVYLPLVMRNR
ncbi:MAG: hypothetical protein ACPLTQ_07985 [Anaerolineae bacterium]